MNTRWFGLGLLGSLLLLTGNLLGGAEEPKADPPDTPVEKRVVTVSQPVTREVADYENFSGRAEAAQSVDLRARVTGYLVKINFKPGTSVKEGEVLFEIDPRPYQAQYDQVMSQVALGEASLKLATVTADRIRKLMQNTPGAVSPAELDNAVAEKDRAIASLNATKAALEVAKLNLEYTKIKAPVSGKIGQPTISAGNLVNQDKTLLATLISVDPVIVYFDVDERTQLRLARMKGKGDKPAEFPIQMGLADEDGFPHTGKVDFVDVQANAPTGTVRWRATFANPDGLIAPGMSARVRLTTSAPYKAMLVPEKAVVHEGAQTYVWIINDKNVVKQRNVKIGGARDGFRVITEGLKPEESVAWISHMKLGEKYMPLREGEVVTPEKKE